MPRTLTISCSPELADAAVAKAQQREGVLGIQRQRGASLQPPGDVVTIHMTNEALLGIQRDLDELQLVAQAGSVSTAEPRSYASTQHEVVADRETNESTWDEVSGFVRSESNVSQNYIGLMAASGAVAAGGLYTDTLHLVVGAMIISPGFLPILRMPVGAVAGQRTLVTSGLASTLAGYAVLAATAALSLFALRLLDPGAPADLDTRTWVTYWSTPTATSVFIALAAGVAGAFVVTSLRSVLAAGVMVALALVPSAALVGMGLAEGDPALAGWALLRWAIDVGMLLGVGSIVLSLKRAASPRGSSLARTPGARRGRGRGAP